MPQPTGRVLVAAMLSWFVLATPLAAHEKHQREAAAPETARSGAGLQPGAAPPATAAGARAEAKERPAPPYRMPPMEHTLLEHLHNKVVHFPLALTVAAALLLVLARRSPGLEPAARWLAWLAGLGAVAAYVTGTLQAEAFTGEPKEWVLRVHRTWGTAGAILIGAWAATASFRRLRRFAWLVALVAAAAVLVAGLYGGVLAHGE